MASRYRLLIQIPWIRKHGVGHCVKTDYWGNGQWSLWISIGHLNTHYAGLLNNKYIWVDWVLENTI